MTKEEWYKQLFERLGNSEFRSSFHLKQKDIDYINEKGLDTIRQHATATCCRECIRKWHKIQLGRELSQIQQEYLVDVIMTWIQREMERNKD
jgi:hypothetical protein